MNNYHLRIDTETFTVSGVSQRAEANMNLFNKLPGFVPSAPGLEQRIWVRLPAMLLWGTLLPLCLALLNRWLAPGVSSPARVDGALLLWDYTMIGAVALHWSLVLTLALACFIVRVMKGPAYVADAYPLPDRPDIATSDPHRCR